MISRRSLFLGSAAVILTPGLLMPVRSTFWPGVHRDGNLWLPADTVTWKNSAFTASGTVGPFRHVLIYDDRTGSPIQMWDYGASVVMAPTETFTADFGGVEPPPPGPDVKYFASRRIW